MFNNFVKTIENWYQVKQRYSQFANIYFMVHRLTNKSLFFHEGSSLKQSFQSQPNYKELFSKYNQEATKETIIQPLYRQREVFSITVHWLETWDGINVVLFPNYQI